MRRSGDDLYRCGLCCLSLTLRKTKPLPKPTPPRRGATHNSPALGDNFAKPLGAGESGVVEAFVRRLRNPKRRRAAPVGATTKLGQIGGLFSHNAPTGEARRGRSSFLCRLETRRSNGLLSRSLLVSLFSLSSLSSLSRSTCSRAFSLASSTTSLCQWRGPTRGVSR